MSILRSTHLHSSLLQRELTNSSHTIEKSLNNIIKSRMASGNFKTALFEWSSDRLAVKDDILVLHRPGTIAFYNMKKNRLIKALSVTQRDDYMDYPIFKIINNTLIYVSTFEKQTQSILAINVFTQSESWSFPNEILERIVRVYLFGNRFFVHLDEEGIIDGGEQRFIEIDPSNGKMINSISFTEQLHLNPLLPIQFLQSEDYYAIITLEGICSGNLSSKSQIFSPWVLATHTGEKGLKSAYLQGPLLLLNCHLQESKEEDNEQDSSNFLYIYNLENNSLVKVCQMALNVTPKVTIDNILHVEDTIVFLQCSNQTLMRFDLLKEDFLLSYTNIISISPVDNRNFTLMTRQKEESTSFAIFDRSLEEWIGTIDVNSPARPSQTLIDEDLRLFNLFPWGIDVYYLSEYKEERAASNKPPTQKKESFPREALAIYYQTLLPSEI